MSAPKTFYYFAYGSNLVLAEMRRTCPSAEPKHRVKLADHALVFPRKSIGRQCGVASVEARAGSEVWGGVYEIAELERQKLESREGFKPNRPRSENSYVPVNLTVLVDGDPTKRLEVMTFVGHPQPNPPLPNTEYKELIMAGARAWNLDAKYLSQLETIVTSKSVSQKEPETNGVAIGGRVNRWASQPLKTSANEFLAAVRSDIPVSLIATPRAELECVRRSEWQTIEANAELADFDQVPLTDDAGRYIEGVFVRGRGCLELREDMFMAADTPLLSFLETADQNRFRFLLVDSTVSGMATISDVQKLPVYSVLFSLLIAVEMQLVEWIRRKCGKDQDNWLAHLTPKQRGTVEKHWQDAVSRNMAVDRLSGASFGQEIQAATGLGLFAQYDDQRARLLSLEQLRHQVCHASEFAPNLEQALKIPACVRDAHTVTAWLQEEIEKQSV